MGCEMVAPSNLRSETHRGWRRLLSSACGNQMSIAHGHAGDSRSTDYSSTFRDGREAAKTCREVVAAVGLEATTGADDELPPVPDCKGFNKIRPWITVKNCKRRNSGATKASAIAAWHIRLWLPGRSEWASFQSAGSLCKQPERERGRHPQGNDQSTVVILA